MRTWTRTSKKKDDRNTGAAYWDGFERTGGLGSQHQGSCCSCRCELQALYLLYFFVISSIVKKQHDMDANTKFLHPGGRRGFFHLLWSASWKCGLEPTHGSNDVNRILQTRYSTEGSPPRVHAQWPVEGGNWEKIQKLKDRYDRLAGQALKVAARSALLDDTKQISSNFIVK